MWVFVCSVSRVLVRGPQKTAHECRSLEMVSDMFGHVADQVSPRSSDDFFLKKKALVSVGGAHGRKHGAPHSPLQYEGP